MSINKPLEEKTRKAIKRICQQMASGELSFIMGTRQVLENAEHASLREDDPDLLIFLGILGETDEVPGPEQLHYWNKVAAANKAPEWAQLENWAKNYGWNACANFISRF